MNITKIGGKTISIIDLMSHYSRLPSLSFKYEEEGFVLKLSWKIHNMDSKIKIEDKVSGIMLEK